MTGCLPLLTLDTSLLLEYWKEQERKDATQALLDLAQRAEVALAVTARIREDVPDELLASEVRRLNELAITETGSITRADYWVIGRDMVASDEFAAFEEELKRRRATTGEKVPDWRDLDHVHAHFLLKRDVFLTWDGPMLRLAEELRSRFGIVVSSPEDYLESRGDRG